MRDRIMMALSTCIIGDEEMIRKVKLYITRRFAYMPSVIHDALLATEDEELVSMVDNYFIHNISAKSRVEMFIYNVCHVYDNLVLEKQS